MNPKDNKKDTSFKNDLNEIEEGKPVFDKLVTVKKIVQRREMKVEFTSQLPNKISEISKKIVPVRKEELTSKKVIPTKNKEIQFASKIADIHQEVSKKVPEQTIKLPLNAEEVVSSNKSASREIKTLGNPLPQQKEDFPGYTKMPVFSTDKLGERYVTPIPKPETNQPTLNKKDSQVDTILPQSLSKPTTPIAVEKIAVMEESISSEINGGSSTQHVTDSPYSEVPVENHGKNLVPRSQEVHDILSYVPSWMVRWGNTVILLIIGGILLMSYYIKYPDVVSGVVSINAAYPPVPLVAKATGAVTLFKEDRERITEEEVIGVIKNNANYKDVVRLKESLNGLENKMEKGQSLSSYKLPKRLQLGEIQSTFSNLFIKLEEKKVQNQTSTKNITRKQNIGNQLKELEAIKKAKEQSLSIKYQEYLKAKNLLDDRYKVLFEKGSISAEQLNAKESEVRNLLDMYQNDRMSFNEIKKRMLDLNSNKEELDFQKEDQEMLTQSSLITAFEELRTAIISWEKRYLLKAPIPGTLSYVTLMKNNMYLQQEQTIANIIPKINLEDSTSAMIGELLIPSIGSGKAAIGQTVNIELNDYPKKQYGVIEGVVESIAGISMAIPDGQGMTGYKVMVSFPKGLENTMKKEIQFKHNMQGKAEIITEDIRLIERFFHELRGLVDAD